jgi:putative transposase
MSSVTDRRRLYPSDLTEAQWESIKDLIPSARRGGRRRTVDVRKVIDGVLYLINTGCQWRYLPQDFPPWKTIYHYYRAWIFSGVWKSIHDLLRGLIRQDFGKNQEASYLIIDSQSVRASQGEKRGYDGFKRVRGRKRHLMVDTMGLMHGVRIDGADLSDTKEAVHLLDLMSPPQMKALRVMHVDMGYRGSFEEYFFQLFRFLPLINRRENTGQGKQKTSLEKKNWKKTREVVKEPKRWVVERTFAWFNSYRRLNRDQEKNTTHSEAMIYIAMIQLMLRRRHPRND